jgi:hypothetical protein
MDSLYFHPFLLEKAFKGLLLIAGETEADPAIRTEVTGDRDEFHGESILPGFLFSPNRIVGRWKEDDRVRHDYLFPFDRW